MASSAADKWAVVCVCVRLWAPKWVSKEKTKWKVDKGWHCRAELVGGKVF